jgi:hypothetical protein
MKTLARITAVLFMILGVLVILGGILIAISGFFNPAAEVIASPNNIIPDLSGLTILIRMAAGGAVGLQGLFLAALGEGLWLLASIADQSGKTSAYLWGLMRRSNQAKQS